MTVSLARKPESNRSARKTKDHMKMRKFAYIAAIALGFAALAGLPSTADALTFGDANDLGRIVPPEPASPEDEEGYVNTLISLTAGVHVIGDYTYTRTSASCGTCPAAVFAFKDESGSNVVDLGAGGFTYLLGKYDGPNGGSQVWNVQGLTGIVTIPLTMGRFGLSHWSLFGGGGGGVPDGGTTVMLLGAALGSLGMARRFLKR
jgi:hypothetical protein